MKNGLKLIIFAISLALSCNASAREQGSIAAVVNDKVITNHDVDQRTKFFIEINGLSKDKETYNQFRVQALHMLIDEKLMEEEAKRLGIKVDKEELEKGRKLMLNDMNLNKTQFKKLLKKINGDEGFLDDQVMSRIVWGRIINLVIEPTAEVSNHEVDQDLANMIKLAEAKNKPQEVKIAEIVLFLEEGEGNQKRVAALLQKLVSEIDKGASFATLAKNFSQGNTANNGGNIGWVYTTQLSNLLRDPISKLEVGQVSDPIILPDRVAIIKLLDRRKLSSDDSISEVSPKVIKNMLYQRKIETAISHYLDKLKHEAYIEIRK